MTSAKLLLIMHIIHTLSPVLDCRLTPRKRQNSFAKGGKH